VRTEETARGIRPLRAWSAADRGRVAAAAHGALVAFEQAWGIAADPGPGGRDAGAARIRCEPSSAAPRGGPAPGASGWHALGDAAQGLWCAAPAAPARSGAAAFTSALARALFGAPRALSAGAGPGGGAADGRRAPGLAAEVAQAAWEDWCGRLAGALGEGAGRPAQDRSAPVREPLGPWSGALALTLPWCGLELHVLVSGERVAGLLGPGRPPSEARPAAALTPVWRAMAEEPARIRAELRAFELDLGALAALRVGDVVRTAHALETPLEVKLHARGGAPALALCAGFLGRAGSARAIELLPASGAPPGSTSGRP